MDAAGFSLNPITAGQVFPDERYAFGRDADSRALTSEQVAVVAAHLTKTPFIELAVHLRPLLDSGNWVRIIDPMVPLPGLTGETEPCPADEETERAIRRRLAEAYEELVALFRRAAENGECTTFWAE